MASLLGFGVLVNYFDRVNLSVSQDALHSAFGISTVQFGYLLSAYSWTYALLQTSFRGTARPLWSASNRPHQHVSVERGFLRGGGRERAEKLPCRATAARSGRSPHVSWKCQGRRILVSGARAEPGNRVLRFCREAWSHDRTAVNRTSAAAFRLAMEFHGDRFRELYLSRPVLLDLSQSQRRQVTDGRGNEISSFSEERSRKERPKGEGEFRFSIW